MEQQRDRADRAAEPDNSPNKLEQPALPIQQIVEIAGVGDSEDKLYCILSLQPNLRTTEIPNHELQAASTLAQNHGTVYSKSPAIAMSGTSGPTAVQQLIISQHATFARNLQPVRSKSSTHFHNSRVLSPQAETSQRIFFSGKYKDLAANIQDGGQIRSRLSHGAFSNVVAAPPSKMIVPDVRSSSNMTPKQTTNLQKAALVRGRARAKKARAYRAAARPKVARQKPAQFEEASTLRNRLQTGETAYAGSQQARRTGGRSDSPSSKFRLKSQALIACNHRPGRRRDNLSNINRDLQNLTHQPRQVPEIAHDGAQSPSGSSPYLNRSAVVDYAAAALALAQTQQSALHAVTSEDLAAAQNEDREAPVPKYHAPDGAVSAQDAEAVSGDAGAEEGVISVETQMKVAGDEAEQRMSVTNPDLITQITLERKASAQRFGGSHNLEGGVIQVPHQCDITSQVQRNLRVNYELRNAKRLMPLYKEMLTKVAIQETQMHQIRKATQQARNGRQQRRRSASKQTAAVLKGMSEAMGIKRLDTLLEMRQKQQQALLVEELPATSSIDGKSSVDNVPSNPTTNIEIASSPKVDASEFQQTADQGPVSQVTVSRNGTPLQEVPAVEPSSKNQPAPQPQSTVLLSNASLEQTGEFVQGFALHEPKQLKLTDKVKHGVRLLKNQRNKIRQLLSQATAVEYPVGKPGAKVSVTQLHAKPTRNNGRRIILTENIHPASIATGQSNLTASGLQKLLQKSDSHGKVIQTSDLLQIQRITPEHNSTSSASFSAHSKQKQILGVIGDLTTSSQFLAASFDQREKNTKPLLTHYQGAKKHQQHAGETANAEEKPQEMSDAQKEILKLRARNDDMLDLFYQGKKQLPRHSIVSRTTSNAPPNHPRANSNKSNSKSNSVQRLQSQTTGSQDSENPINLQVLNSRVSPYQTFKSAVDSHNKSPNAFNKHVKGKPAGKRVSRLVVDKKDLNRVNSMKPDASNLTDAAGLQRQATLVEQREFIKLQDNEAEYQHYPQPHSQQLSQSQPAASTNEQKSGSRGRQTIDLKGVVGRRTVGGGGKPLSSKRTTIQKFSKGISCSLSQASDWLNADAGGIRINRSTCNVLVDHGEGDEEDQSDYDDQELIGEDEHIKLQSIMQPNSSAMSSRRSSNQAQHHQQHRTLKAVKKKNRVVNNEGTQLLQQRVSHTSHSGSIKRIVMQKKGTGPASTPDGAHYLNQDKAGATSDTVTIQSRVANQNQNQPESFFKLQKASIQGDSGQNSRSTLKIRIKIEKNHQVSSSRSSSVRKKGKKKSLTGTIESNQNGENNIFNQEDNYPRTSSQANTVIDLNQHRLLRKKKSSGASTLRHQNSILTSLHPSVRNLHAQESLLYQNQNLPDGSRPKKWLSRVVSHQHVVQNWLNNSEAEMPELINFRQSAPSNHNMEKQQASAAVLPMAQSQLQEMQMRAQQSVAERSMPNQIVMLGEERNSGVDMFHHLDDGEETSLSPQCVYNSNKKFADGMDSDLISQIRNLTKEYRRQSREQFKRYQYTGHKAASAAANRAGQNANRAQRGHSSNVYRQQREGRSQQSVYQDYYISRTSLGTANWNQQRKSMNKHVLEGDTGTNQDYLSKLQIASYLNTPLNQSHQANRSNIFMDTTKDSYATNASSQLCAHHRKSLLQPPTSSGQNNYSHTALAKRNLLLRHQYNAVKAAVGPRAGGSASAAALAKQPPAAKKAGTSAARMRVKGTQLSSAMVSMGTASTSGLTNTKRRPGANKSLL